MIRFRPGPGGGGDHGCEGNSRKKYIVRLSGGEREQLAALIRKGRSPAYRLLKARILLKADLSEAGEGWSDNQIIDALGTSASMVYRVRKQLVEEGFESVLSRKPRATPAVPRIFDGEKDLSDAHFPDARKIILVQDNLSTHKPASLYEAFPAAEARRLVERFEWHYTPKHGSWLDMASPNSASSCVPAPRSPHPG